MALLPAEEQKTNRLKLRDLLKRKDTVILLKEKLGTLEVALEECVEENGCIKKEEQEKWGVLLSHIKAFKDVIEMLEYKKEN